MKRSRLLSRGTKGYNWYTKFIEHGTDGFRRNVTPTPFNWTKGGVVRPVAFFDLALDAEPLGRVEFELAEDVVPQTVANFTALCTGQGLKYPGYKGTKVHQIQKGQFFMAGDISGTDGGFSHAAGTSRHFDDENFIIPHSDRGLLSMASVGINTNGSQFYVSMSPTPQMNGRCVVFGRLIRGDAVLEALDRLFCFRGAPARSVGIINCGIMPGTGAPAVAESIEPIDAGTKTPCKTSQPALGSPGAKKA